MDVSPHNIKPREVYCPKCKKTVVTDAPGPTCEECFGSPMLTVLRSVMTGRRLDEEPLQISPLLLAGWRNE